MLQEEAHVLERSFGGQRNLPMRGATLGQEDRFDYAKRQSVRTAFYFD